MEEQLRKLISNCELIEAPHTTKRIGKHYEFIIGIGNDETASITMTEEAYRALVPKRYKIEHTNKAVICSGSEVSMNKIQKHLGENYQVVVDNDPKRCCS